MYDLLRKYGGEVTTDDIKLGRRRMRLVRPPRFMALNIKRFVKTQFFWEKNPTIVNFPIKNLEVPVAMTKRGSGAGAGGCLSGR